jgi:hypothetical protein
MKPLWTRAGTPALAIFLGLSIQPFWSGDLDCRGDYSVRMSFWRALAAVPGNAPRQGIGGAVSGFCRENTHATASLLGYSAALCLLFCPFTVAAFVICSDKALVTVMFLFGLLFGCIIRGAIY